MQWINLVYVVDCRHYRLHIINTLYYIDICFSFNVQEEILFRHRNSLAFIFIKIIKMAPGWLLFKVSKFHILFLALQREDSEAAPCKNWSETRRGRQDWMFAGRRKDYNGDDGWLFFLGLSTFSGLSVPVSVTCDNKTVISSQE